MTPNSELSAERRAGLAAVAGFAVLTLYFTGLFPPFGNPNELSRLEMVFAFVEQGTFRIDGAIPVLGDHEDKAVSGGHFYSNKAPGLAFAAIPVYRVLRVFFPPPRSASDAIFVLLRILTVSVLCVVALARFAARLGSAKGSALLVFALAFGTPLLFYGRSFFGHAWTAALLFLAWDLARKREERAPAGGAGLLAESAGLLCGWAAISEYTAAPLAMLLALRVARRGSWRTLALFAAGAAVPLLLLLSYDASCFGSPWVLSSAREAHRSYSELAGKGLFGFGAPSPRIARDGTGGPTRCAGAPAFLSVPGLCDTGLPRLVAIRRGPRGLRIRARRRRGFLSAPDRLSELARRLVARRPVPPACPPLRRARGRQGVRGTARSPAKITWTHS